MFGLEGEAIRVEPISLNARPLPDIGQSAMWNSTPLDLDSFADLKLGEADQLPPIQPHFFFTPLQDKPQDPILDAIKAAQASPARARYTQETPALPKELAVLTTDLGGLHKDGDESPHAQSPLSFWCSVFEGQRQAIVSTVTLAARYS